MTAPHALEPCPFCGAPAEYDVKQTSLLKRDFFTIWCSAGEADCGSGACASGDTLEAAAKIWNRRAPPAPLAPDRDLWAALMFVKHPDLLRLRIGDEFVSREEWIDAVSQRIEGAAPLAPRWMPIATAPKDREILVYTEEDGVFTAIWRDDDWQPSTRGSIAYDSYAEKYTGHGEMCQPTHWCEKPGAPDQ